MTLVLALMGGKLDDPATSLPAVAMSGKLDDPMPLPRAAAASVGAVPDGWPPRTLPGAMRPATSDRAAPAPGAKSEPCPLTGDPCRCNYAGHCGKADCPCPNKNLTMPRRQVARPPQMWQMKDRRGRTWQDADPAWLRTWVAGQDAIPDAPAPTYRYAAPTYGVPYGAACVGGACSTSAGFRPFGR